jgi:acetyl-CoA carboxylase biotin carboxyl carrier protein
MNEQMLRDFNQLGILFREGGWRELRVTADGFSLLFSNDPDSGLATVSPATANVAPVLAPDIAVAMAATVVTESVVPAAVIGSGEVDPAWHAITAPNLGTFYRSPKPGSPPFVELGQQVTAGTELCLLEVMKLFTSVSAGVAGTIAQVCVADGELVEGEQVLFYIQRD